MLGRASMLGASRAVGPHAMRAAAPRAATRGFVGIAAPLSHASMRALKEVCCSRGFSGIVAPKIIYTHTDEAPALATYALLPIIKKFTDPAGITVPTIPALSENAPAASEGRYALRERALSLR